MRPLENGACFVVMAEHEGGVCKKIEIGPGERTVGVGRRQRAVRVPPPSLRRRGSTAQEQLGRRPAGCGVVLTLCGYDLRAPPGLVERHPRTLALYPHGTPARTERSSPRPPGTAAYDESALSIASATDR